jgi:hypothetical protein
MSTKWQRATQQYTGTSAGIHPDDADSDSTFSDTMGMRTPNSVVRYPQRTVQVSRHPQPPVHARASRRAQPITQPPIYGNTEDIEEEPRSYPLLGKHPMRSLCIGLLLFFLGWFLLGQLINWYNVQMDQFHYGYPRTYQTDKDVGHGGVSHFTVENIKGRIYVMEIPSNDSSKAKLYPALTLLGENADLAPAVVTFSDANGDGRLDMIIDVQNAKYSFLNGDDGLFHNQQQGG